MSKLVENKIEPRYRTSFQRNDMWVAPKSKMHPRSVGSVCGQTVWLYAVIKLSKVPLLTGWGIEVESPEAGECNEPAEDLERIAPTNVPQSSL